MSIEAKATAFTNPMLWACIFQRVTLILTKIFCRDIDKRLKQYE